MKRILLILGGSLTLVIAAACGPNAGNSPTFPTNTTGPTLAPTLMPSEMPSSMPSEMPSDMPSEMPTDGESPAAS